MTERTKYKNGHENKKSTSLQSVKKIKKRRVKKTGIFDVDGRTITGEVK